MKDIPHVLIVKHPKGFTAHLRYQDAKQDKDLSSTSRIGIYVAVEKEIGSATH